MRFWYYFSQWGGWRDSNSRHPESQSSALTNWATAAIFHLFSIILWLNYFATFGQVAVIKKMCVSTWIYLSFFLLNARFFTKNNLISSYKRIKFCHVYQFRYNFRINFDISKWAIELFYLLFFIVWKHFYELLCFGLSLSLVLHFTWRASMLIWPTVWLLDLVLLV